ncbi:hypothetical protein D3C84_533280 [compost metagenome]
MHCSSLEPITNLKEDSNPSLTATFRTDKPLISKEIRGFFFACEKVSKSIWEQGECLRAPGRSIPGSLLVVGV